MATPPQQPFSTVVKSEDVGLAAISLSSRIPEFWTDLPRVWFLQLDAMLAPQKLADSAKFNLVVSKLGKEVIQQITDILISPPTEGKYELLKSKLLAIYEESEGRQIQKLIGEMELGDQKPSQLLRKMQDLARGKISGETLSVLWQNHLPAAVRGVLAATEAKEVDRLAIIADKVVENMRPQQVSEVAERASESSVLLAEIAKLSARMDQLQRSRSQGRRGRGGFHGRPRSRGRSNSKPRRTPDDPDWLCTYHYRYRTRANRCEQPCSWKPRSEN